LNKPMIQFEDILDDAARYMRGEMDVVERQFFEELLRQNPALQKDLHFMQLTRQGLIDLDSERELIPVNTEPVTVTPKNNYTNFALLAALILTLALFYWTQKDTEAPQTQKSLVIYPTNAYKEIEEDAYIYINQLSGTGQNTNSDRGHGVSWLPNGQVAFSGTFEGRGMLAGTQFQSLGQKDIIFGTFKPQQGFNWVRTIGSEGNPDFGKDIIADSQGNLMLTGSFGGTAYFSEEPVIAKGIDDMGDRDFFLAKFSSEGKLLWLDHAGGLRIDDKQTGINSGLALGLDAQDNVMLIGAYIGSPLLGGIKLPEGGPNEDLFLAKYSPAGKLQWVNTITGNYMVIGTDVATSQEGNIFVTGSIGHHNLGGWAKFGRDTTLHSIGGRDIFLAKYNPQGQLLWVRQSGSGQDTLGFESATGIAVDNQGNSLIAGNFVGQAFFGTTTIQSRGGRDIFLAKYNPEGELLWVNRAGSAQGDGKRIDIAQAVASGPDESILMTGSFTGTADFGSQTLHTSGNYNFFLAKYSKKGHLLWAEQFEPLEGFVEAQGNDIDIDPSGNIVVTGFFSGGIKIGDQELHSEGREDIFVLIFNDKGAILSAKRMIAYNAP